MNVPKGMVPVEEFGKSRGIKKEKTIQMIKDGFYAGRVIDDEWFVEPSEQNNSSTEPAMNVEITILVIVVSACFVGALIVESFWLGFLCLVGMIFGCIFIAVLYSLDKDSEFIDRLESILKSQNLSNYIFYDHDNESGIAFNGFNKKMTFWKVGEGAKIILDPINTSDILGFTLKIDESEICKTNSEGAFGRALIGGILLGGAGAVIGAVSAKQSTISKKDTHKVSVEFLLDDVNSPLREIVFYLADEDNEAFDEFLPDMIQESERLIYLLRLLSIGLNFQDNLDHKKLNALFMVYENKSKLIESESEKRQILGDLLRKIH